MYTSLEHRYWQKTFPGNAADDRWISYHKRQADFVEILKFHSVTIEVVTLDVLQKPLDWGLFVVDAYHCDGDIVGNVEEAFDVVIQSRVDDRPDSCF